MLKSLTKTILAGMFLGLGSSGADAQDFDRSVVEPNLMPDTTAPSVTIFLDNLKPPRIRIRPAGVTWISFPYEVRICESSLKFVTVEALKPKDSLDQAVSILSVNVDAEKMSESTRSRLAAGLPVPPINVNCLLAAGQKKMALIFLDMSSDATFLVNLQVKKRISKKDLGGLKNETPKPKPENDMDFPTFAEDEESSKPKIYEVGYHKELVKYKPSDLRKKLLSGGDKKK